MLAFDFPQRSPNFPLMNPAHGKNFTQQSAGLQTNAAVI